MGPPGAVNLHSWHLLQSGPGDYALNMAWDEALLHSMRRLRRPVIRFYNWTGPAASFGYFQRYTEVECLTSLRPLVRRPTGGGLVPHDADWTYSMAFPPGDAWYSLDAVESYQRVHQWIQAAFSRIGVATEIATVPHKAGPGQCFQGHEQFDLLWHGRKIAGAAQRRTRDGLLIQGSVQPAVLSADQADWHKAMCAAARMNYRVALEEFAPDDPLRNQAEELARRKYSQAAYNRKR